MRSFCNASIVFILFQTPALSLPPATTADITQSISTNLNGTKTTRVMSDANYENVDLEHPEFRTLNLNLFVDTDKCGTEKLPLKVRTGKS